MLVVAIDVVAEVHGAVTRRPAGEIDPGDWDLLGQLDVEPRPLGDGGVDLAPAPARLLFEEPGGKIARLVDAGAAGGLKTIVGAEKFLVVGVVHVDGMRVRHVDAHGA